MEMKHFFIKKYNFFMTSIDSWIAASVWCEIWVNKWVGICQSWTIGWFESVSNSIIAPSSTALDYTYMSQSDKQILE